jgi:exopolysaccharide biosynthesis polyprenyl glycosylphosphotransferase
MLDRLRANRAPFQLVLDLILTESALFLAGAIRPWLPFGSPIRPDQVYLAPFVYVTVTLIWGVIFLLMSAYEPRERRPVDEIQMVFGAVSLSTLALAAVLFLSLSRMSRLQLVTFYAFDLALLIASRRVLGLVRRLVGLSQRARCKVLILGAGEAGHDITQMIERYRWAGLEPIGFLDDGLPRGAQVAGYPVLGKVEEVAQLVEALDVDEIVVALPLQAYDRFFRMLDGLQRLPVSVRLIPEYLKETLIRTRVEEFAGVPMITLQKPTLTPFERKVKRAFDLIVGSCTLVVLSPLLVLVAIAIHLDSPGPVIFRQRRVGESGKLFWMYKFRSMVKDAEQQLEALERVADGPVFEKLPNDPRVTRVGKVLRRTSLDEIPQILNVIKGEMSLVGPRPEVARIVEMAYQPWQWQRFTVPQGITGWWQVNGRSDKPLYLHTEEDLFYIQNYSFLLDVQILFKTASAVLKRRGAF